MGETANENQEPPGQAEEAPTPTQENTAENCEVLEDIPDEDEIFNINVSESEKEQTYFFEEDEEDEERLRNLHLATGSDQSSKATDKNKKQKNQALITCPHCPDRHYNTIESYVKHKETHALSSKSEYLYVQYPKVFIVFLWDLMFVLEFYSRLVQEGSNG